MKTITFFEFSYPSEGDLEILKRLEGELEKVNRNFNVFERTWRGIRAKSYVGVLSVKEYVIQILPKLYRSEVVGAERVEEAVRNLLFMLSYTKRFKIREVGVSALAKVKTDLYEVIVYLFAKNLGDLLKRNFRRDYEKWEERLKYVKGKVLVEKQVRRLTHEKIYCSYYELSENNWLNKVLKYTCHLLSQKTRNERNWRMLQEILGILGSVDLVPVSVEDIERVRLNRLNEEYQPLLDLCKLFLENMSLELQGSRFKTFSLIFDMNTLFEEFIGEVIRRNKNEVMKNTDFIGCNVRLQMEKRWLVEEPKAFSLIPDIILTENGNTRLIIDTKYKLLDRRRKHYGVSQDDIYQAYAYAKKFNCNQIILLYPWNELLRSSNEESEEQHGILHTYKFDEKTKLHIATVNLMKDLRKKENFNELKAELNEIFSNL